MADQSCSLRADTVDEYSIHHAEQSPRKQGYGDHQTLLPSVKVKIIRDLDAERAQNDPDHKTHIEIKKRRDQSRRMTGFEELFVDHDRSRVSWYGVSVTRRVGFLK